MFAEYRPRRALDVQAFLDSIVNTLSNVRRQMAQNDFGNEVLDNAISVTERCYINLQRVRPLINADGAN